MSRIFIDKVKHLDPAKQKLIFFALKIIIALLVLSILVRKISFSQLTGVLSQANNAYIFSAAALLSVNIYFQFAKWQIVVHHEYPHVKNRQILYSLFVGMALGLATPGRIGDFGRTFFIKNVEWPRLLGLLMIDKLITLAVLYFVGIIGLSHFISMRMHSFVWLPVFIMTIALAALFLLFLLRPELLRSMINRYQALFSKYAAVENFLCGIESATPKLAFRLLALTIFQTVTYCSQFVLLVLAFYKIPIIGGYLSTFAVMFTKSLLPFSFGDLGIRESAAVYFFGQFHVPAAAAFNASFLLFTINILLPSVMGLGLLLFKRQTIIKSNGKSPSD